MTIRPVLPMINYAVNYDYIVENLCENRAKPELMCKGKCYVSKELNKNNQEQTTQNSHKISVPTIDVFMVAEDFKFTHSDIDSIHLESISTFFTISYYSEYYSKIFHPPTI